MDDQLRKQSKESNQTQRKYYTGGELGRLVLKAQKEEIHKIVEAHNKAQQVDSRKKEQSKPSEKKKACRQ